MNRLLAILAVCLSAFFALAVQAEVAVPALKARVTDLTGSLPAQQLSDLNEQLAGFEASKGSQIAVLLLPSTQPESIEQFGIRLMDSWKIGRKGVDDGVILIVATEDRRLRIEVGYGLEGALNDATAKRIIAEVVTPKFKAGDLPGGVMAGVEAIIKVVDGEPLPEPKTPASQSSIDNLDESTLLFGLAAAVLGGAVLRHFLGTLLGSGIVGAVVGGAGWLMTGTLSGLLIGGAAGFFIALFGLELLLSGLSGRGGGGGYSGGGGGGFSGGGGGGGGGGASGSW